MKSPYENTKIPIGKQKKHWFEKLAKNKPRAFGVLAIIVLSGMIAFQIPSFFFKNSHRNNAVLAEVIFAKWKASPDNLKLFESLHSLLQKNPDLQRKFEGLIAQVFIHSKQPTRAVPFVNMALKRLNEDTPYYAQYAEASLLIAQGAHSDALLLSRKLKDAMTLAGFSTLDDVKNLSMDSLLYGFNLIRMGFLHKTLHHEKEELSTWNEVEKFLLWGKNQPSNAQTKLTEMILDNFREKQIMLPDFIQSRKSVLRNCPQ